MTEKRTDRPPKYTEAQVLAGIDIVERGGETPTGDTVKKAMCVHLDVPPGINAQSLDREVQRLLEERDRLRREQLRAALPAETRAVVAQIGNRVENAILDHLGHEHEQLRTAAGQMVAAMQDDLGHQREQIRELLSRIDMKDDEIAGLEADRADLKGRLDLAAAEIDALKEHIAGLEREDDFQTRMLAMMKQALGEQPPAIA